MITLAFFTINRKVIKITIDDRIIRYFDDNWPKGVQMMPLDTREVRNMMLSRSENLKLMAKMIREENSGESLKQYNLCKTDEELAEMVRKDCQSKGLMEIKK